MQMQMVTCHPAARWEEHCLIEELEWCYDSIDLCSG